MKPSVRHQLWIAAMAMAVFFTNLGVTRLWDQDEAFFARTAVEMHERHDWVVPYFNGELFAHKPPLMFWMMRIGFLLFGVTEFAARFWSAVFGLATALLTYHVGRRMFNENVGLWAGLAMGTALMFDVVARAATPDSFLVFFCTLVLYVFVRKEDWDASATARDGLGANAPLPWSLCFTMYAVMGVAVLVKGPIGVLLPGSVIGLYLLVRDPVGELPSAATWGDRFLLFLRRFTPPRIFGAMWWMRPLTAVAAVTFVAGPWFALVGWRTGGEFLSEFFGVHNYGRFLNSMDNHSGPIWYYVPAVLIGFFPWSIFGIPTTLNLIRRCRATDGMTPNRGDRFVVCWIVVYLGFFSLAGTKLPSYVLPAYPALALATACFVNRWLQQPAGVNRWWPRLSFGSLLVVGLTLIVGGLMIAGQLASAPSSTAQRFISPELHDEMMLVAWLGAILLGGGIVCFALAEIQRRREAAVGLAITSAAFCVALFAGVAVRVDRHQPSPNVAEAIRRHTDQEPQVAQFGYFRPSLVYYTGMRVEACKSPERVAEFLQRSADAFLVTTEEHYSRLTAHLPADIVVLDRQPEFPRHGAVMILGHTPSLAHREKDIRQE